MADRLTPPPTPSAAPPGHRRHPVLLVGVGTQGAGARPDGAANACAADAALCGSTPAGLPSEPTNPPRAQIGKLEGRLSAADTDREHLGSRWLRWRNSGSCCRAGPRYQQVLSQACRRAASVGLEFTEPFEEWHHLDAAWWATEEDSEEERNLGMHLDVALSALRDTAANLKHASGLCLEEPED